MSQYSSSNYSQVPASYPYPPPSSHSHSHALPSHIPPPPPPPPSKPSTSYSHHRGSSGTTSSHHTTDYRYHPYSRSTAPPASLYPAPYTYNSTSSGSTYPAKPYSSSSRHSASSSNLHSRPHSNSHSHSNSKYSKYSHSRSDSSLHSHHHSKRPKAPRNEFGIPFGQPGAGLSAPDWAKLTLPLFRKNFYREAESITAMDEREVLDWRKQRDVVVLGDQIPRPIRSFSEAGFPSYIQAEITRSGFTAPTEIQSQGWPMAMSGRDVIGIAETGSGKTLAFLLPCIVHINAQPLLRDGDGPIVLIIAPTRELAMQIEGEASKFAYSSKIKHCCVYGGVSRRGQMRSLRGGVEIIICTPGRLLDFLECGVTNLKRVTYLVIDEADRLLDMGFEPQLSSILSQVRPDRQILMWSATWPKEVRELSQKYFLSRDVIQVSIGQPLGDDGRSMVRANHNVKQIVDCFDNGYEKQDKLYAILGDRQHRGKKLLVFACTKKQCDYLYKLMKCDGYKVCVIHGDKQQYERDAALGSFKNGENEIMIATDVASRGIHIDDIHMVVNYDFPQNIEDYVHRIGRTGRCGNKGIAVSFFTRSDCKRAAKLIHILKEAKQAVPKQLVQYSQMMAYGGGGGGSGRYKR